LGSSYLVLTLKSSLRLELFMSDTQLNKRDTGEIAVSGCLGLIEVAGLLKSSKSLFNGQGDLTFDLSAVEKSDSSGLALLVEWMSMAKKSSQDITFQGVSKQMLDIARVSGLDKVLPLAKSKLNNQKVGVEIDG